MTISHPERSAHIVGLGLIGGSIALALANNGWFVSGYDEDRSVLARAISEGFVASAEPSPATQLVFICTPAGSVIKVCNDLCETLTDPGVVFTDVSGVKRSIADGVSDSRFVGGHPMAGSEQRGLDGSSADMFVGCTWVLTPKAATAPESYASLHTVLRSIGAQVLALTPELHDRLVAMASHIPHIVAGALMNEAHAMAEDDAALLRLAAGGFRDMTRIAAGDSAIWPDVLISNQDEVEAGIRRLQDRLSNLATAIRTADREALVRELSTASQSRRRLPTPIGDAGTTTTLRIPVPDEPGVLSTVTTTASDLGVNIFDIEIAHAMESTPGVLLITISSERVTDLRDALQAHGFIVGVAVE